MPKKPATKLNELGTHGGKRTVKAALANERVRNERLAKTLEDGKAAHKDLLDTTKELLDRLNVTENKLAAIEASIHGLETHVTEIEARITTVNTQPEVG